INSLGLGKNPSPFASPTVTAINGSAPPSSSTSWTLQPGDVATVTVTPGPITLPVDSATLNDPNGAAYSDVLTVNTSIVPPTNPQVTLIMKPRGTIITGTPTLTTTWNFQTVAANATSTITSAIVNTGNSNATVSLKGVAQPTIFHLAQDPTTVIA